MNAEVQRRGFSDEKVTGVLRGIRSFALDRPRLRGWWNYRWHRGQNLASCGASYLYPRHETPDIRCTCGFYQYWTLPRPQIAYGDVLAVAEGSGLALIGDLGFRSEKAEILAVAPNHGNKDLPLGSPELLDTLRRVSAYYCVPLFGDVDALLAACPVGLQAQ